MRNVILMIVTLIISNLCFAQIDTWTLPYGGVSDPLDGIYARSILDVNNGFLLISNYRSHVENPYTQSRSIYKKLDDDGAVEWSFEEFLPDSVFGGLVELSAVVQDSVLFVYTHRGDLITRNLNNQAEMMNFVDAYPAEDMNVNLDDDGVVILSNGDGTAPLVKEYDLDLNLISETVIPIDATYTSVRQTDLVKGENCYYIAGKNLDYSDRAYILKVDTNFNLLWEFNYNYDEFALVGSINIDSDGNLACFCIYGGFVLSPSMTLLSSSDHEEIYIGGFSGYNNNYAIQYNLWQTLSQFDSQLKLIKELELTHTAYKTIVIGDDYFICAGEHDDQVYVSKIHTSQFTDVSNDDVTEPVVNLNCYPNPFNPNTTIEFTLANPAQTGLAVYNIKGQLIKQLINQRLQSGNHKVHWNGTDSNNNPSASGIYFSVLKTEKSISVNKITLLK